MKMRLRTLALSALTVFSVSVGYAQAREPVALSLPNGEEAIQRYADMEARRVERVFTTTATFELGECRRTRSAAIGKPVLVVWCPIAWRYSPAINDGGWEEVDKDYTRVLAIRSPSGCLLVKEAWHRFENCLWLTRR